MKQIYKYPTISESVKAIRKQGYNYIKYELEMDIAYFSGSDYRKSETAIKRALKLKYGQAKANIYCPFMLAYDDSSVNYELTITLSTKKPDLIMLVLDTIIKYFKQNPYLEYTNNKTTKHPKTITNEQRNNNS